jgi:LPXTG-motif cell wall-anchored protein
MKCLKIVTLFFVMAVFSATVLPQTGPGDWNQKTILTFNEPVELPGIVLSPDTYVFKLAGMLTDRNVIQVFDKDENHLYATILAIPDHRDAPEGKTVLTFKERAPGSPKAIKAWFYSGDTYGHEFVYPKATATELANANQQQVPSMPAEMAESVSKPAESPEVQAMETAPLTTTQPSENEAQLAEAQPSELPPADSPAFPETAIMDKQLPKTASPLPWFLLIGTVSLLVSLAFRIGSKRTHETRS